jgi:hypothetical protein
MRFTLICVRTPRRVYSIFRQSAILHVGLQAISAEDVMKDSTQPIPLIYPI